MRYKTFRNLVVMGAVALLGLGAYEYEQHAEKEQAEEEAQEAKYLAEAQSRKAAEAAAGAASRAGGQAGDSSASGRAGASGPGEASGQAGTAQAGDAGAAGGVALREFDERILAMVHGTASSPKVKDALGKGGPKVNLYADDGSGYYNRVKIDLNRNEKWDEKWTLEKGQVVKRQVAPADDEKYTEEYRLAGRRWVRGK